mgnify:FL=1
MIRIDSEATPLHSQPEVFDNNPDRLVVFNPEESRPYSDMPENEKKIIKLNSIE